MPNLYETSQKNIQALILNKKTLTNNLIKKYGKQVVYGEFLSKIVFDLSYSSLFFNVFVS